MGYSLAAQYGDLVEKVVICGAGVSMEEKDLREGNLFRVSDLEEAAKILVPQTPERLRELMGYTFFKPLPLGLLPSCWLTDYIDVRIILWPYLLLFSYVIAKMVTKMFQNHQHFELVYMYIF